MLEPSQEDHAALERLAGRVPWMLERAAALRNEATDPRVQLAALAPRWLTGMAAVAVLVTAAAVLWPSAKQQATSGSSVDRFVVSGSASQDQDPVSRALLR